MWCTRVSVQIFIYIMTGEQGNETNLSTLIKQRGSVKGSITKLCNYFKDLSAKPASSSFSLSAEALLVKEERIRSLFKKYEEYSLQIIGSDSYDEKEEDEGVEDKYLETLTTIKQLLNGIQKFKLPLQQNSHSHCHAHTHIPTSPTKLPDITIPAFTGKYSEYKAFMGLFNSIVHSHPSLEDIQKFYYLRSFLKDEPLELTKNLPMVHDSYEECLKILNDRYDNDYRTRNEHIGILLNIPAISRSSAQNIRQFLSALKQQLAALKNLGCGVDLWDPILLCILLRKLDFFCKKEFELSRDPNTDPTVLTLVEFLEKRALALENAVDEQGPITRPRAQDRPNVREGPSRKSWGFSEKVSCAAVKRDELEAPSGSAVQPAVQPSCLLCKYAHKLFTCGKFKLMSSADRLEFIQKHLLCKICLNKHTKPCRYHFKCDICKQKHNTLLHQDNPTTPVTLLSSTCPAVTQVLLPTARVKIYGQNGIELYAKVLLDSAAQVSFVTSKLVEMLKIQPITAQSRVLGIGDAVSNLKQYVQIQLHSLVYNYKIKVSCFILDKITSRLPQQKVDLSQFIIPPNIDLADENFHEPGDIHILLGADIFFQVLLSNEPAATAAVCAAAPRSGLQQAARAGSTPLTPIFLHSQFGHLVAGNIPHVPAQEVVSCFCTKCDAQLNNIVTQFWQTESVPQSFEESNSEHDKCEQIFKESVKLQNKKFEVALPLKLPLDSISETLGDSLHLALKRFYNLEKRLQKDKSLLELYKSFIHDFLDLGHASIIDISQYNLSKDPVYILPHHPVVRMDKKTTKCRTVFDGSMKTNKKVSLNNLLLNGPVVQKELFDILLLFRTEQYVFVTDIKHMFRAISLDPRYRSLQNILWRDSPESHIQCIQLNTVTYGLKSSSYLATRCLLELAEKYSDKYPKASFILKNQTYVDDILTTSPDLASLIESKEQLRLLLEEGGFQLHKWSSNKPEILHDIPQDKQYFDEIELQKDNVYMKTLGINFDIKTDSLILSAPSAGDQIPETKRQVLSFISRFYDPLGLAGPLIVSAKVIMQKLWQAHMGWDTVLSEDLKNIWHQFFNSLAIMKPIQSSRWACSRDVVCVQLIGFADASSSTAYGCCIYSRVVNSDGTIKICLLCSKSRINPCSQTLTVPRLELNAALLLAKLVVRVHETLSLKIKVNDVVLYSDSQIVLAWIATNTVKLNTYVANRVREISRLTNLFDWAYVSSENNPADCLSRGLLPHELEYHHLWWKAPKFLHCNKYEVPRQTVTIPQDLPETNDHSELSRAMVCAVSEQQQFGIGFGTKFSDISKMSRVLAYVLRFCHNSRPNAVKVQHKYLTCAELQKALLLIIKIDQSLHFKKEIQMLKASRNVSGPLKDLHPFLDQQGLLRVGGRLHHSDVPYSQKHPVILPKGSRITDLIISREHIRLLHAGPKLLLSRLNEKYWLVNGLRQIKKVTHKCITCFRLKANAAKQLMGSLPEQRVTATSKPFQRIGIDYCGPFQVKNSRVRRAIISKGYVCVFVCFVTKAIHLEASSDLSTDCFMACFKRFISRRGLPSEVFCDNGGAFRGAGNQLNELYKLNNSEVHQTLVQQFSSQEGIKFHFTPSYSPVFAGLAEAGVKSFKYHLKRIVQKCILTYEQLNTVLVEIEAVLNSRPLLPLSSDITDFSYITPGHFLIGTALTSFPEQDVSEAPVNRLKFWQVCTHIKQCFWKIWHKYYLNILQSRPKWRDDVPNISVGTLVILREANTPPLFWPMARVVKVFPGSDNKVRAFEVKAANGKTYTRSLSGVSVLPLE